MNRKRRVIEQHDSWYAVIDRASPGPDHWAHALCQDRGDARYICARLNAKVKR